MSFPVPETPLWYVYDSTKIQEYLDCPRQFFYKRILGWDRETPWSNDLQFGKAWHKAMELLYNGNFSDANVARAYEEGFLPTYREVFPPDSDELFEPKTPDNALIGLSAYSVYPANVDDLERFKVIKTEIAGSVLIDVDGTAIIYKIDLLYQNLKNNKYGALEHKTKKNSFSRTWTDQWDQSIQIGNYNHALNMLVGNEDLSNIEGITVNGAAFLKTKNDFARVHVRKNSDMMVDHIWTVREIIDRMKMDLESLEECSESDRIMMCFPRNPQSCTKYYGCEFMNFCSTWPNPLRRCQNPPIGYVIRHWDPLAEEAATERIDLTLKEYV